MPDVGENIGAGLSGAGFGSKIGSMFGPAGTAIGAGVGFLAGGIGNALFGKKKQAEQYVDPNTGMIDSQIFRLLDSHLGEQLASRQSSKIQRNAQLQMQQIGNRPGMSTSGLVDAYDQTQRGAEGGMIDAQLAGAQLDQRNRQEATGLLNQKSQRDFQIWDYNKQLRDQPSTFGMIGQQGLASMASEAAGGDWGTLPKGDDSQYDASKQSGDHSGTALDPTPSSFNAGGVPPWLQSIGLGN